MKRILSLVTVLVIAFVLCSFPVIAESHMPSDDSALTVAKNTDKREFSGKKGISRITVGNGVTVIGEESFSNCPELTCVSLPDTLTEIGKGAFSSCKALTRIVCTSDKAPVVGASAFDGCGELVIYAPKESADAYKTAFGVKEVRPLYKIKDAAAFCDFLYDVSLGHSYTDCCVVLENDIDLGGKVIDELWTEVNCKNGFKGIFDGQGHTISNYTLKTDGERMGLFRTVGGAVFENLNISDFTLDCSDSHYGAGGLIGYADGDVYLYNVHTVNGCVNGNLCAGGLVGEVKYGSLTASYCSNSASVTAKGMYAGGILGGSESSAAQTFRHCVNTGNISATLLYCGGIAGMLGNTEENPAHNFSFCENRGSVTVEEGNAGGIVGGINTGSTENTFFDNNNSGTVTAKGDESHAGGIVGYIFGGGRFDSNVNSGAVTGETGNAGGILGYSANGYCDFAYGINNGEITAGLCAGGIAGGVADGVTDDTFTFDGCLNTDKLTGAKTGDICGWNAEIKCDPIVVKPRTDIKRVIIVCAIAAAVIAGGIAVILIIVKKKKEQA